MVLRDISTKEPGDIDIITFKRTAISLMNRTLEYWNSPLAIKRSDSILSHFGVVQVNEVRIEVMADALVKSKEHDQWISLNDWDKGVEYRQIQNLIVPITSLSFELQIHSAIGAIERVRLIESHVK